MKTGGIKSSLFLLAIALAFAGVSLWSTTDLLRKNDQAAILAGAHDWARGDRQAWSRYYQFDKTYVLYAYTAAFLKANRALGELVDPVALGNHVVASAFWLALFVFSVRFRRTLSPLVLCAVLASPAVLFNTQYVNSTVLSSAFFLLALAALGPVDRRLDGAVPDRCADGSNHPQGRASSPSEPPSVSGRWSTQARNLVLFLLPARWGHLALPALGLPKRQGSANRPGEPQSVSRRWSGQPQNLVHFVHAARRDAAPYRWPNVLASSLLVFLAVGSRADIILLLPLWFGLILGFPTFGKMCDHLFQGLETRGGTVWGLGLGAVAALCVGRIWADGAGTTFDPFFQWKMALGYLAFGFGGALLLFGLGAWGIWQQAAKGARWIWVATFLLPVFFFLPQLHAPRYFWRGAEAVMMLSACAPACLPLGRRWCRSVVWLVVLVPLLVGLNLPLLTQPRPTVRAPTLFPSGDGHYPMGAYGAFLQQLRKGTVHPIDHNQRVWAATRSAELVADEAGRIPVLFTPMFGYFMLEASLRGYTADHLSWAHMQDDVFYMDSRTLTRQDMKFGGAMDALLDQPITVVSPDQDGIVVLKIGAGDTAWGRRTRLLNRLFAGNEYRIVAGDVSVPDGHPVVWFAERPFAGGVHDEVTGWYYSRTPADTDWLAYSALPGWMSVQAFAGE